jgi:exopolysaccharide production protein ExoQ
MPPPVALAACLVFLVAALILHHRCTKHVSGAVWISAIWMAIIGSRPVTFWFGGFSTRAEASLEGSSVDMLIYSALIGAGVVVLVNRSRRFENWFAYNKAITILLVYIGLSVLWSDIPLAAFKRYIKLIGMFVMVLILSTDDNPVEAIKAAIKRCAYLLIPTSMLLIKYYPQFGLAFDYWTGERMMNGVTIHKNLLGQLSLIVGLAFIWIYHSRLTEGFATGPEGKRQKWEFALDLLVGATAIRTLILCDSKTSLVAFILGALLYFFQGLKFVRGRTGIYISVIAIVVGALELTVGLYAPVLEALGRDPTLTNRTLIWATLLPLQPNILFGAGHESFWTAAVQRALGAANISEYVNESHNGFLEIYLGYGLVGLSLYLVVIVSTYRNVQFLVRTYFGYGRFAYAFLMVVLAYNMTESAFRGLALIPLVFYLLSIDLRQHAVEQPAMKPVPARSSSAVRSALPATPAPAASRQPPSLRPGQISPRWQFKAPKVAHSRRS